MLLAEDLYLLVCKPEDGTVSTLDYTRVKRCLQGALAWELGHLGALQYADGKVSLGPQADALEPEIVYTYHHLREQTGPIPIDHLIFRLDNQKGTMDLFFAERLHRAGLLDRKEVTRLLVFHSVAYPRKQAGESRVAELRAQLRRALEWFRGTASEVAPAQAIGLILLDLLELLPRALDLKERLPAGAAQKVADAGFIPPDLLKEFPQLTSDVSVADMLWSAGDLVFGSDR